MQVLLYSAVAGICGMGMGGLVSVILLHRSSENMTCWMLSFAAGIMTSIVCFGLMPEAIDMSGIAVSVSGLIIGVIAILLLNRSIDKITKIKKSDLDVHRTPEELHHENIFISSRENMLRSGVIMLVAIGLHNIPEGIAIGAGGSYNMQLGFLLSAMIALHNIPEGMAIAAPLLAGEINRWKVLYLTALSGAPTLLGALIGILIGNLSDFAIAISLSAAGGAMLYVVFGEIIPQSVMMTGNRIAPLITLLGMIVGLAITRI